MYLQQQALGDVFPSLRPDVLVPEHIPENMLEAVNLWIGPGGNTSPLHFDDRHNLFAQIHGHKRFALFAPADYAWLYPYPVNSSCPHASRVSLRNPDLSAFPNLPRATRFDVTV